MIQFYSSTVLQFYSSTVLHYFEQLKQSYLDTSYFLNLKDQRKNQKFLFIFSYVFLFALFFTSFNVAALDGVILNGKLVVTENIYVCDKASGSCHKACNVGNTQPGCVANCSASTYNNCVRSSTAHGGTSGTCRSGYSGSCSYRCDSGTWQYQSNSCSISYSSCSSSTYNNCYRSGRSHGGYSGSCISGYTGSCSYYCNNGFWQYQSNSCSVTTYSSCSASTYNNCVRSYTSHNGTSGTCASGYSGSCSYRCNDGSWQYQSNSCTATPIYRSCSSSTYNNCYRSSRSHGSYSGSCVSGYTGNCSYRCNDGSWNYVSNSCTSGPTYSSCSSTTISNCVLSSRSHNGTSGSCRSGYTGSCSYRCNDGTWQVQSNTCGVTYSSCSASTYNNCVRNYTSHNGTSGSCAAGYTGNCSYRCNNGSWNYISNTCTALPPPPLSCSSSTISNCVLSYTNHGGSSGTCAAGYTQGSCSYTCDNGSWSGSSTCAQPINCAVSQYTLSCSSRTTASCCNASTCDHGVCQWQGGRCISTETDWCNSGWY